MHVSAVEMEKKKKIKISLYSHTDYQEVDSKNKDFELDAEDFTNAMVLSLSDTSSKLSHLVIRKAISYINHRME